jgi:hypothetical protein
MPNKTEGIGAQMTSRPLTPEQAGLNAVHSNRWPAAVMWLSQTARDSVMARKLPTVEILDALGEAAYRAGMPEALSPFQNLYKYPLLASHMARAFLMLGDRKSAKEFLGYASDSGLKAAVAAMLELDPDSQDHHRDFMNLAAEYPDLGYAEYWRALAAVADAHDEAELIQMAERKSQGLAYGDPNVHFNQALRMLSQKHFVAGWRLYESRLIPGAKNSNRTSLGGGHIPMWEGQDIRGKKLIVSLEQGLGDLVFALRYIQPLRDLGITVGLVARPGVLELIRASFPDVEVWLDENVQKLEFWENRPLRPADYWVYSLSVPAKAGWFAPINTGAYLSADTEVVASCRSRVGQLNPTGLPVYTVNWHGRIDTRFDRSRAFTVDTFLDSVPILEKPCMVISVQKDATDTEIGQLVERVRSAGGIFLNAGPELDDFGKTAAWVMASDHLVTCDTSVAHLGGALGHPTTVLVRNKKIWQWVLREEGGVSIWYDSAAVKYALLNDKFGLFTGVESGINQTPVADT